MGFEMILYLDSLKSGEPFNLAASNRGYSEGTHCDTEDQTGGWRAIEGV